MPPLDIFIYFSRTRVPGELYVLHHYRRCKPTWHHPKCAELKDRVHDTAIMRYKDYWMRTLQGLRLLEMLPNLKMYVSNVKVWRKSQTSKNAKVEKKDDKVEKKNG